MPYQTTPLEALSTGVSSPLAQDINIMMYITIAIVAMGIITFIYLYNNNK